MFNYHMTIQKHFQYLDDITVKGFTTDIYFENFDDALNLFQKLYNTNMYDIRISKARLISVKNKKYPELAGKKILPSETIIEFKYKEI